MSSNPKLRTIPSHHGRKNAVGITTYTASCTQRSQRTNKHAKLYIAPAAPVFMPIRTQAVRKKRLSSPSRVKETKLTSLVVPGGIRLAWGGKRSGTRSRSSEKKSPPREPSESLKLSPYTNLDEDRWGKVGLEMSQENGSYGHERWG